MTGQLAAIEKMISDGRPCEDVLAQLSAVRSGVESVSAILFQKELRRVMMKRRVTDKDLEYLTQVVQRTW